MVLEGQGHGGAQTLNHQPFGAGEQGHISTRARARSGVLVSRFTDSAAEPVGFCIALS